MKIKNTNHFVPFYFFFTDGSETFQDVGLKILAFWIDYFRHDIYNLDLKNLVNERSNLEFYDCGHDKFNPYTSRNSNFPYEIQFNLTYCIYCGLIND